jgi:hypothetical protein
VAVSKRLRYEVLRRDDYTCRYCGESAPDVKVTVDHVIPKALGGTDDPANLVTACKDCNGGKTSTNPDAPLVADVAQDALRWSRAIAQAAQEILTSGGEVSEAHKQFANAWDGWTYGGDEEPKRLPKDPGWKQTVDALLAAGLPMVLLEECVQIAMARRNVAPENTFRYMCGVAWNKVGELQKRAREIANGVAVPGEIKGQPGQDDIEEEARQSQAHRLLSLVTQWDRDHYADKARWAAEPYEPTDGELEVAAVEMAVRGLVDERDRLYDITMGLLHALPDGKERWDSAVVSIKASLAHPTPTDIIEGALFDALTNDEPAVA